MKTLNMMFVNAGLPTDFGGVKRKAAEAWARQQHAELCALVRPKPEVEDVVEVVTPCGYCGCTEPLCEDYPEGWPFCPQCHGV